MTGWEFREVSGCGGLLNPAALPHPILWHADKYRFAWFSHQPTAGLCAPVPRNAAGLGGNLGGNRIDFL